MAQARNPRAGAGSTVIVLAVIAVVVALLLIGYFVTRGDQGPAEDSFFAGTGSATETQVGGGSPGTGSEESITGAVPPTAPERTAGDNRTGTGTGIAYPRAGTNP